MSEPLLLKNNSELHQNIHFWFDEEKNKYFLINNETGETKEVTKSGEPIKQFDASLTGSKSYKQRFDYTNQKELLPHIPSSIKLNSEKLYYNPVTVKFDGYSQYPCPVGNPYDTKTGKQDSKERIRELVTFAKKQMNFISDKNQNLFKKTKEPFGGTFQKDEIQTKQLSKSVNSSKILTPATTITSQTSNSLKHLTSSIKFSSDTKNPNGPHKKINEALDEILRSKDGKQIKPKYASKMMEPHLMQFTKNIQKVKDVEAIKQQEINDKKIEEENLRKAITSNVNTIRYVSKINDTVNKTIIFSSTDNDTNKIIKTFNNNKGNETLDIATLTSRISFYDTQTYDKKIMVKQEKNNDQAYMGTIKTEGYYLEKQKRESMELKGTDPPTQKNKPKISMKGRMSSSIPTPGDQYKKDRELMKKVHPELYVVKENKAILMKAARMTKSSNDSKDPSKKKA